MHEKLRPTHRERAAYVYVRQSTVHQHQTAHRRGGLPATHVVEYAPWVITRTDLQRPTVQARIQAVHQGHQLPRTIPGQDELPLKCDTC